MTQRDRDFAQTGDIFFSQLAEALAAQEPAEKERLERELKAGNYEFSAEGGKMVLRIAGSVVIESQLYREPDDVKHN